MFRIERLDGRGMVGFWFGNYSSAIDKHSKTVYDQNKDEK